MKLRAVNAIRKAESLRMRGRGSGGYYLDGGILWGCEVTCVAQAPDDADEWDDFRDWDDNPCYDSPWDWENTNSWSDFQYDGGSGGGSGYDVAADDASRDIENGQRILSEIESGNVQITATEDALDVVTTLGSAAAAQSVVNVVNKLGQDLFLVRNLGKNFGILGAGTCLGVAIYDIKEEGCTESNVLDAIGAATGLVGLVVSGPVGWVCGGVSLGIAIYSFCVSEPISETQTTYR